MFETGTEAYIPNLALLQVFVYSYRRSTEEKGNEIQMQNLDR